jgi:hypothetical protein
MKKIFRKHEINYGCYTYNKFNNLWPKTKSVSILQILKSPLITIKDKRYFIWKNCNLTLDQKKQLGLRLGWIVLPIFETKYPDDKRIRDCLQAIEDFNAGKISIDILKVKKSAAVDAAAAAAAAADAVAAAVAAADAAAAAVAAADAAAAAAAVAAAVAAAAAAAAADNAEKQTYTQLIQKELINFVK